MRRKFRGWFWALPAVILILLFLSACGGGNKAPSVGPPATVTLSPSLVSIKAGDVLQMTISVKDAAGNNVLNPPPTFSSDQPNVVQISTGGLICAGTWLDATGKPSLTSPITCVPAAPGPTGILAKITATAGTVTSAAVNVFVHMQVTSIVVTPPNPPCEPQAGTVQFTAQALNGTSDITASVGQINWQVSNGTVASADPLSTGPAASGVGSDPTTVTAKLPGKAQIFASVDNLTSPVTSTPATFIECPIVKITVTAPSTDPLSGPNATVQLTAVAVDTTGAEVTSPPANFTAPTLTWASNPAAVAAVNASGLVTGRAAGTAGIVVGCVPSTCNIGLEPVYSEVTPITVSGASSTTAYATSVDGTTLVPINTSNNTAGAAISLPANQKKNSMVFSPSGDRAFLGTDAGMLSIDLNANTAAATVTAAPGKVLAVSPDSSLVLISDTGVLRLFNGSNNTTTNFNVAGATAAAFTPDGSKVYIAAAGKLFVLQAGSNIASLSIVPSGNAGTDVTFLANGNFAYLATQSATSVRSTTRVRTCDNSMTPDLGGAPTLVRTLPNGKQVLEAEESSINALDVPTPTPGTGSSACPSVSESFSAHSTSGSFVPLQLLISPDSSKAFVISKDRMGSVLAYDVGANAAAGSPSTIPLAGGTAGTTTGGITPDSKTLYVGATDNAVHVIDIATGTDTAQVPLTFTPDFVGVRPR